MSAPFVLSPVPEPGFLRKIFKSYDRDYFMIEIENALSKASNIREAAEEVNEIKTKYGITNIYVTFQSESNELMEKFLLFAFEDKKLSDNELADAIALGRLIGIRPDDVNDIRTIVAKRIFSIEAKKIVSDGVVNEEENKFLSDIQKSLSVDESAASSMVATAKKEFIDSKLTDAIKDERLSDEDVIDLERYKVQLELEDHDLFAERKDKALLAKYRLFWQIENGIYSPIEVNINLTKGEECYFTAPFNWLENRTVRVGTAYSGPQMRLKIAKGIYWRSGVSNYKPITREQIMPIDSGQFYLTNKRLVLVGTKKSISIKLEKVLAFERFKEGVFIQKDTGKSPFLEFEFNPDIFCAYLGKLLVQD